MMLIFILVFLTMWIVGGWTMFQKAGQPGWACVIPIYNMIVLVRVARLPAWWVLLAIIPYIGWLFGLVVHVSVANRFGRGVLFGLCMGVLPFVFYPVIGLGNSRYEGDTLAALDDVFA